MCLFCFHFPCFRGLVTPFCPSSKYLLFHTLKYFCIFFSKFCFRFYIVSYIHLELVLLACKRCGCSLIFLYVYNFLSNMHCKGYPSSMYMLSTTTDARFTPRLYPAPLLFFYASSMYFNNYSFV